MVNPQPLENAGNALKLQYAIHNLEHFTSTGSSTMQLRSNRDISNCDLVTTSLMDVSELKW